MTFAATALCGARNRARQSTGVIILAAAIVSLVPMRAVAQDVLSVQDLALRVNLGDWLRIDDDAGNRINGRLTRLTREDLTVSTDGGERRVTAETIREVAVRRQSSRHKGVLIGAGAGVATGALLACTGSDRSECADGPILLGALGAGVGLALSAVVHRTTTIYAATGDRRTSHGLAWPAGPLDALALRVDLDDWIRVDDRSGTRIVGRLTRLTGEEMTIETNAGPRTVAAASIRAVAARRYPLRMGALIGAGVFAVVAATAPACRSNPDCTPLAAAPLGAGVGLAVGALVPLTAAVYPVQQENLSFSPTIVRGGVGIRARVQW